MTETATPTQKTVEQCDADICDMIKLHDETQERWKEIVNVYKEKMDTTDAHVKDIFTMLALGKEDMAGIRKNMKNVKRELEDEQKRQEKQIKRRDEQLTKIDKKLDLTLLRLDYKKKADEKRNGKLDKIDEEEDRLGDRVSALEGKLNTFTLIFGGLLSLIAGLLFLILQNLLQHGV